MLLTLAQQVTACRGEAFVNKALLEPSHSHLLLYYLQLLLHQNSRGECLQQRLYGLLSLKYLLSDSYLTYPAHLTDVPSLFLEVIFNIYLWLLWVFLWQVGATLPCGAQAAVFHGVQSTGSTVVAHGLSCSSACGIFPDQGSNPCPLTGRCHQGSP